MTTADKLLAFIISTTLFTLAAYAGDVEAPESKYNYVELKDAVSVVAVDVDERTAAAALHEAFTYSYDRGVPGWEVAEEEYRYDTENSVLGYEISGLEGYVFVQVGYPTYGVAAIKKDSVKDADAAQHHFVTRKALDHEPYLFSINPGMVNEISALASDCAPIKTEEEFKARCAAVTYLYYWHHLAIPASSDYFDFGRPGEGFYFFPSISALRSSNVYLHLPHTIDKYGNDSVYVANTIGLNNFLPESKFSDFDKSGWWSYYVYSWDLYARTLFLWSFYYTPEYGFDFLPVVLGHI